MARRAVPVGLLFVAALAESFGRHDLVFYALLAAVPFAAVAALSALGDVLDVPRPFEDDPVAALQMLLWAAAVGLIVLATSSRASVLEGDPVGALGRSALMMCIGVLALEAVLALVTHARQPRTVPAAPLAEATPAPVVVRERERRAA